MGLNFDPPTQPGVLTNPEKLIIPKGASIHRIWNNTDGRAANAFNPGYGDPTRFAPLDRPQGKPKGERVGTLYAGATFDVAVYETLFRDLLEKPNHSRVSRSKIGNSAHCRLIVQKDISLVALYDKHLKKWGTTREALICCQGKEAYLGTVKWAEAIYDRFPDIEGLVWMSRQDDSGQAYMFFEDRVGQSVLRPDQTRPLSMDPGKTEIEELANRDEVVITAD